MYYLIESQHQFEEFAQQQQQAAGGKTVIIKEKEAATKPADQPKPKKKEGDEFKEEAPKW